MAQERWPVPSLVKVVVGAVGVELPENPRQPVLPLTCPSAVSIRSAVMAGGTDEAGVWSMTGAATQGGPARGRIGPATLRSGRGVAVVLPCRGRARPCSGRFGLLCSGV